MADTAERLAVLIEANTKSYERAMTRLEGVTKQGFDRAARSSTILNSSLDRIMATVRGVGGTFLAAFGASALARTIGRAIDAVSELGDAATRAGVSVEFLQVFRTVVEQAGGDMETADKAAQNFTRNVGRLATTAGGPAERALANLNVRIRDVSGAMRPSEELMREVIDRLSAVADTATRSSLAAQIFGAEYGPRLAESLSQGTAGMAETEERMRRLGIVMSEDAVRKAQDLGDQLSFLGQIISTRFNQALLTAVGAGDGASDSLERLGDRVGDFFDLIANNIGLVTTLGATLAGWMVGGPIGAVVGLIGGIAFNLSGWREPIDVATASMELHEQAVNNVLNRYATATGQIEDWAAAVAEMTLSEALLLQADAAMDLTGAMFALSEAAGAIPDMHSTVMALAQTFLYGADTADEFIRRVEGLREQGYITAEYAAAVEAAGRAFNATEQEGKKFEALLIILRSRVEEVDEATLSAALNVLGLGSALRTAAGGADVLADSLAGAIAKAAGLSSALAAIDAVAAPQLNLIQQAEARRDDAVNAAYQARFIDQTISPEEYEAALAEIDARFFEAMDRATAESSRQVAQLVGNYTMGALEGRERALEEERAAWQEFQAQLNALPLTPENQAAFDEGLAAHEQRLANINRMYDEIDANAGGGGGGGGGGAVDEQTDKITEVVNALNEERMMLGMTAKEQAIYNALAQAGIGIDNIRAGEIVAAVEGLMREQEALEGLNALLEETKSLASDFFHGLLDALEDGKLELEEILDLLDDLKRKLLSLALDMAINNLFKALSSIVSGAVAGGGRPILSAIAAGFGLAGARAAGGPVQAGRPYLVGERSPELFIPNASGIIRPGGDGSMGGGGVLVQIINNAGVNVQERRRRGPGGRNILQILLDGMREGIGSGFLDDVLGERFGAKPRVMGRGS